MGNLAKELNRLQMNIQDSPVPPKRLASLLSLVMDASVQGNIAQKVLEVMFLEEKEPLNIIEEKGWNVSSDTEELEELIETIIRDNPQVMEKIKAGNDKPRGFIVGKVMAATRGTADPQLIQKIISGHVKK